MWVTLIYAGHDLKRSENLNKINKQWNLVSSFEQWTSSKQINSKFPKEKGTISIDTSPINEATQFPQTMNLSKQVGSVERFFKNYFYLQQKIPLYAE